MAAGGKKIDKVADSGQAPGKFSPSDEVSPSDKFSPSDKPGRSKDAFERHPHHSARLSLSDDKNRWQGSLFGRPLFSYPKKAKSEMTALILEAELRFIQAEISDKLKRKAKLTEEASTLVNEDLSLIIHDFKGEAKLRGRVSEIHEVIAILEAEISEFVIRRRKIEEDISSASEERHQKNPEKAAGSLKKALTSYRENRHEIQLAGIFDSYRDIQSAYFASANDHTYPIGDYYGVDEKDLPEEVIYPDEGFTPILAHGDGKKLSQWVFVKREEDGRLIVKHGEDKQFVDLGDERVIEMATMPLQMEELEGGIVLPLSAAFTPDKADEISGASLIPQMIVAKALKDHPTLGDIAAIGSELMGRMEPLRVAVVEGLEGYTKDDGFLKLIQSQAKTLGNYYFDNYDRISALYEQLLAVKDEIEKSKIAGRQTEFARNIESLIGQIDAVVAAIEGIPKLCDIILDLKADHDERIIKQWLATDGLVLVTAIAGGVLVMTGVGAAAGSAALGTIPSLAFSASAMGVGGVAGQELGTYLSGEYFDTGLESGMQLYLAGEMGGDKLGEYYMKSWAMQSASSFGFMLAGKALGELALRMAASSNASMKAAGEGVLNAGGAIQRGMDGLHFQFGRTRLGRLLSRVIGETGGEVVEETAENVAGAAHPVLGTVATMLNSMDGRNVWAQPAIASDSDAGQRRRTGLADLSDMQRNFFLDMLRPANVASLDEFEAITDEERLIEIAKTIAARDGAAVSVRIHHFRITDQAALIEIAKIAAAQSGFGISAHIQNYRIRDQKALIEIARIAAAKNARETSAYIHEYGIRDQAALIEIAKIAATENGAWTSSLIKNYGITNQAALIEIAKIAAAQNGSGTSQYIENYGINDQVALVEIAKIAAAEDGGGTSLHIQNYGITDRAALVEIAKIAAAQDGRGTSEHIKNYGITDRAELVKIAKIAAAQSGWGTSEYIKNYGVDDQAALIEIAKIAAAQSGEGTSLYIQNYGITDPAALVDIAKIAAAQSGWATSTHIQKYGITNQAALIEIAKIAAAQEGWGTSAHIQKYGITGEAARTEIAKIAAAQDGRGTSEHIKRYEITDEAARIEIAKIALRENPAAILIVTMNYDLRLSQFGIGGNYGIEEVSAWAKETLKSRNLPETYADCLYTDMKRRDVGVVLFFELLHQANADPEGLGAAATQGGSYLSRHLLEKLTGLDTGSFKTGRYSERALGDLYEMALGIPEKLPIRFSDDLVSDRNLRKVSGLMHGMVRLRGILAQRNASALPLVMRELAREDGTEIRGFDDVNHLNTAPEENWIEINVSNAGAVSGRMERTFLTLFREIFRIGDAPITIEQIGSLENLWGDLGVFYTLAARFSGQSRWRSEMPLLGRVAQSVLEGKFAHLKYKGLEGNAEDVESAHEQLSMLRDDVARAGWMGNYHQISVYRSSGDGSGGLTVEELFRRSKEQLASQTMGHVAEHFGERNDENGQLINRIKEEIRREPKPQTIQRHKNSRTELAIALFELAEEAEDVGSYSKILTLIRGNSDAIGLDAQLRADISALSDTLHKQIKGDEAVVFTTTTDDPKLLLMTGSLADVSSCQNYRTGSHIHTLLGYVVDANVKLMLSYAVTRGNFKRHEDYERFKGLVNGGAEVRFDAAKQTLKVGDMEAELKQPTIRRVIKLGETNDGGAGVLMERPYRQGHFAEGAMNAQIEAVHTELAEKSKAATDKTIKIPPSRNPGGVYSDAAVGVMKGRYTMEPQD